MKKKVALMFSIILFTSIYVVSLSIYATGNLDTWVVSSYENVFRNAVEPANADESIQLTVARNEYEAAQILTRSSQNFTINNVEFSDMINGTNVITSDNLRYNFVEYSYISENTPWLGSKVATAPGYFPEALSNESTIDVVANSTQPIWIKTYIPKEIPAGTYEGTATVSTTIGDVIVDISLDVKNVTIPDSKDAEFEFEFWTRIEGNSAKLDGENFIEFHYDYDRYTADWWRVVGNMADLLKENRSNVLYINIFDLLRDGGSTIDTDGNFHFDWTRFDEYIEFMIGRGVVKKLAGCALVGKKAGVEGFVMNVLIDDISTGKVETTVLPVDDPYCQNFISQFIPELSSHLQEKEWSDMWYQHIGDEPGPAIEQAQWTQVKNLVKQYASEIKVGDAYVSASTTQNFIDNDADYFIPIIHIYEQNISTFQDLQDEGKQVWIYTTGGTAQLNRLTDDHVWEMNTLGWLMYKRGITGFLHWGWNYWINFTDKHDTYTDPEDLNIDGWPVKGSNYCVHPDLTHDTVKSSIRYEATRDASEDYELFKILERRDRNLAMAIAGSIVTSGSVFSDDTELMVQKRAELVVEAARQITSLAPIQITTQVGTEPNLPEQVNATYDGGTTGYVDVIWEDIDPTSYSQVGSSFTVEGTVEGTTLIALASVSVLNTNILFHNDFEDNNMDSWTIESGSWDLVNNDGNIVLKSVSNSGGSRIVASTNNWTDYSVETDMKKLDVGGVMVLCFKDNGASERYFVTLNDVGILSLRKKVNGVRTVLQDVFLPINLNQTYHLKVDIQGNSIDVYLDGNLHISETDSSIPSGRISLHTWLTRGEFDDITVTELN